jgi:hypothetical protein
MKHFLIFLLLISSLISFGQDSIKDELKQSVIKTNVALLTLQDRNITYSYVHNSNAFEIGMGYRYMSNYENIPEKSAYLLFDVTSWTRYRGPHISLGYKKYFNKFWEQNKTFFTTNLYYKYNNYPDIAIFYGSNGTSGIRRQLINEEAHLFGVRLLFGKEINIFDSFVIEVFGGTGYVFKFITRKTISEGYSGNYTDHVLNEVTQRNINHATLQFGLTFGYIL